MQGTGEKYVDNEFPAQAKSLITDWNEDHQEVKDQAKDWGDIEWIRA